MPTESVPEPNDIETAVAARAGDTLGYARVSTNDQNLDAQRARLIEAGAIRVFTDIVSGKRFERPGLAELIDHARPGDRLCVIRLDRLGRSLRELLETVDGLKAHGIHLVTVLHVQPDLVSLITWRCREDGAYPHFLWKNLWMMIARCM